MAISLENDEAETAHELVHGNGEKILIVDDEADILEPLKEMLRGLGYMADSAVNGEEGISKYESWKPDAVLMDRNMPVIDGISITKTIISVDPAARIVLISGYDREGVNGLHPEEEKLIKDYITKPIDIVDLSRILARLFQT